MKYLLSRVIVALFVLAIISGQGAADGLSTAQKNVLSSGVYFFNTEAGAACSGTATTLVGSDKIQQAFNYFVGKGLTAGQSAGIVGNLMQEHGLQTSSDPNGVGIAQWTGGRDDALNAFATTQGKPISDLGLQLDFLWQELSTSYSGVLSSLKASQNYSDATNIFVGPDRYPDGAPVDPTYEGQRQGGYENPGLPAMVNRLANAQQVLATYGSSVSTASNTSSSGVCTGGGNFATNFTEYKQCIYGIDTESVAAKAWATSPYGNATICDAGCGPSAMAMIITNLTGQHVTPDMTAAYGAANGTTIGGGSSGSSWNIASVVGSHWGLKASDPLGQNITAINQVLQSGGLVLATGTGAAPFTTGGHFIVIRALTSDGKWLTGNSAGIDSSQPYDPASVIAGGNQSPGFNAWGLTKQ